MTTSIQKSAPGQLSRPVALAAGILSLPLWIFALSSFLPWAVSPVLALFALNTYGAVMLGFLAGITWTVALLKTHGIQRAFLLAGSVVFVLLGAFAAMPVVQADLGLLFLMIVFAAQWLFDVFVCFRQTDIIGMVKLRTGLTLNILASLVCAWWLLV